MQDAQVTKSLSSDMFYRFFGTRSYLETDKHFRELLDGIWKIPIYTIRVSLNNLFLRSVLFMLFVFEKI